jgi:hypothetical protein
LCVFCFSSAIGIQLPLYLFLLQGLRIPGLKVFKNGMQLGMIIVTNPWMNNYFFLGRSQIQEYGGVKNTQSPLKKEHSPIQSFTHAFIWMLSLIEGLPEGSKNIM